MNNKLFNDSLKAGAKFSECRKYRYCLWRIWDDSKPKIMFIGLNPSTADENMDDATIKKVKKFAESWGYGGVYMCNLFAFITPYPKVLKTCKDPIKDNDTYLRDAATQCQDVLFAWGAFKEARDRANEVIRMFDVAVCLGINLDGSPKHPLYIKDKTHQINFK